MSFLDDVEHDPDGELRPLKRGLRTVSLYFALFLTRDIETH